MPQTYGESDDSFASESAEEKSGNAVHIQMCENCIDSLDDIIVDLDNAITDGMPVNDQDSPMQFEDYKEPLISSSKVPPFFAVSFFQLFLTFLPFFLLAP